MTPLVHRLSNGQHPVSLFRYKSVDDLKEAAGRGLVLVKFTGTQGGTELGVALDAGASALDIADGRVSLSGSLTLDYVPVRCTVTVDTESLTGHGQLEPLKAT
jgi:hypothetical protein